MKVDVASALEGFVLRSVTQSCNCYYIVCGVKDVTPHEVGRKTFPCTRCFVVEDGLGGIAYQGRDHWVLGASEKGGWEA